MMDALQVSVLINAKTQNTCDNTIRSWIIVNSLGDREVEDNCCCGGQVFFNTIRSWIIVNSFGAVKSRVMAAVEGKLFF